MFFVEIILVAVALAIDAFSAAICQGLKLQNLNFKTALIISLFFGGFSALMCGIGYFAVACVEHNSFFQVIVEDYAGLIAFLLLFFIGGKNILDTIRNRKKDCNRDIKKQSKIKYGEICLIAFAVSIDALMTGFAYALMQSDVFLVVSIIGFVSFVLSIVGVYFGNIFGSRWRFAANIASGIVLILLGIKFYIEFLGLL